MGAAILAAVGFGEYKDVDEAADKIVKTKMYTRRALILQQNMRKSTENSLKYIQVCGSCLTSKASRSA